ncbi:MAG: hypothetical protein JSR76_03530 [Verrucomicrobia bacterium]|nr:hypothetical protein [Verrucomicrobiota bacterium]
MNNDFNLKVILNVENTVYPKIAPNLTYVSHAILQDSQTILPNKTSFWIRGIFSDQEVKYGDKEGNAKKPKSPDQSLEYQSLLLPVEKKAVSTVMSRNFVLKSRFFFDGSKEDGERLRLMLLLDHAEIYFGIYEFNFLYNRGKDLFSLSAFKSAVVSDLGDKELEISYSSCKEVSKNSFELTLDVKPS